MGGKYGNLEFKRTQGSTLEELINRSNEQYREKGLALIQKVPTPITPVRIAKGYQTNHPGVF